VPAKGKPTVVATVAGSAYELRPTADGGVSFLRTESGSHTSTVAHEHAGVVTTLGSGELARMHLFQGRDGHAVLSGASTVDAPALAMAGVISVGDKALPHGATGSSLDGDALAGPDADGQKAEPVVLATKIGQLLGRSCPASTGKASSATAAFVVTAAPSSVFSAQSWDQRGRLALG
jgi:hypothetical protein